MRHPLLASLVVVSIAAGCAQQPKPAVSPRPLAPPKRGVKALKADLASYYQAPAFQNAVWGVLVKSLATGETLFTLNPGTFLMPASNMKVVTMAAAAERLGWDFTFTTKVLATGPVEGGVLKGDLVVVGSGDPSLGGRPTEGPSVVERWADQIRARGITRVEGRVVGHDNVFDDEGLGQGWAWDYLAYGYATPVGGLGFNENVVRLSFAPGAAAGDPVAVAARPDGSGLDIAAAVTTAAADAPADVTVARHPGSRRLGVTGSVPAGKTDFTQTVSVENPTEFMAGAFLQALLGRGIEVTGGAVDVDALSVPPDVAGAETLVSYSSPPLSEIGKVLLKVSQNLYADTLLKAIGRPADGGPGTTRDGRRAAREVLQGWGIAPEQYLQADGSGLSRYNYLTADVLVAVLTRMYADDRHYVPFITALPVAGVDGTIAGRMKDTLAQGNARAKTGSIAHARALSGYVTSADGEPLVFSMIVNNFSVPQSQADAIIDRAVVRLAEFRR
ncbi:MAG: D-alanyl-D-alanine carboxypeptidase/D-alanyl-D-alanine-endopeptidase [Vicinamibacterales bacterium]